MANDPVKSLRLYLLSKTAITDIVSQRISTKRLKQNETIPAITLRTISETHDHAIDGLSGSVSTRIQLECFAIDSEVARTTARAVMACGIDQQKGTYQGTDIRSVMVEDGIREYEDEDTSGGDYQRHVASFDLMIHWLRSA